MRGEYKTPGGKLVAVTVEVDGDGKPISCVIDGDFFVDTDNGVDAQALLAELEVALVQGASLDDVFAMHPATRLVGTSGHALHMAYRRALAKMVGKAVSATPSKTSGTVSAKVPETGIRDSLDASRAPFSANFQTVKPVDVGFLRCGFGADIEKHKILRQWRERWDSLHLEIVVDVPRTPAEQMALDERWAREVADGKRSATLRFWTWSRPAVVVGRFQSIEDEVDLEMAENEGFEVVRRCTGGGAMFVEPVNVITFSLYVMTSFVQDMDVVQSYEFFDLWLVEALRRLGFDIGFSGMNDIASSYGKLGGAAQKRFSPHRGISGKSGEYDRKDGGQGSILHHVTLSYDTDTAKMARLLKVSAEKRSDKAIKSAVKSVDSLKRQTDMTRDELVDYLVSSASRRYNIN